MCAGAAPNGKIDGVKGNVEIKARVRDPEHLSLAASRLADAGPRRIEQEDFFFDAPRGRLKLRCFPDGRGELIYYERADRTGPKTSSYVVVDTPEASAMKRVLEQLLDPRGVVRKTRDLYLIGQTRIHLDEVEGLGRFVELEVVLEQGQSDSAGVVIARDLMRALDIRDEDLVDAAYIDLLSEGGAQ